MEERRSHILIDAWTRDPSLLEKPERAREVLLRAAREAGAEIIGEKFHTFSPAGYTGCVLLSESHIAIHSWVDEGLLTVDVFACRPELSRAIVERICTELELRDRRITEIRRGGEPDHDEAN